MEINTERRRVPWEREQAAWYGGGCRPPARRGRKLVWCLAASILCVVCIVLGMRLWQDRRYYLVSLCMIIVACGPFVMSFEGRRPQARQLVVIAVMAALGIVGRAVFYMLPFVKPTMAVVILAAIYLGPESGFFTGALAAFGSNFLFGQGPWTPWQMFAMGIVGAIAGILFFSERWQGRSRPVRNRICISLYGFFSVVILYGLLMDTASVLMYTDRCSRSLLLASYASGLPVNLIHGISTCCFLWILEPFLGRKLHRVRVKYDLIS